MENMIFERYDSFYKLSEEIKNPKLQEFQIKTLIQEVIDNADKFDNDSVTQYHAARVFSMISDENNKYELIYLNRTLEKNHGHLPALVRRATIYYEKKDPMFALADLMLSKKHLEEPLAEHCLCDLNEIKKMVVFLEQELLSSDILLSKVQEINKFESKNELMRELEKSKILNSKHSILIQNKNYEDIKDENKRLIKVLEKMSGSNSTKDLLEELKQKENENTYYKNELNKLQQNFKNKSGLSIPSIREVNSQLFLNNQDDLSLKKEIIPINDKNPPTVKNIERLLLNN